MAVPSDFLLSDEEFEQLQRLISTYRREGRKCRDSKSYFAGRVMLGAALEASVMAMVQCFPDEAGAAPSCPKSGGSPRSLRKWRLNNLLAVAHDLSWLPAKLDRNDECNHKLAQIGDYADVIRQIRNLVHPARFLEDMPHSRLTKKHLDFAEEVLGVVADYLYSHLVGTLRKELPDEE